jgi:hypothetical protein
MTRFLALLAGLALPFIAAGQGASIATTMDIYVFPKQGQDAAQQSKDEAECYEWAVSNAGVDPFDLSDQKAATEQQAKADQQAGQGSGARGAVRGAAAGALIGEIANGIIYVQGIEDGRAFSFVIHESTGHMTAAIARDRFSVTVFGACTDVDI